MSRRLLALIVLCLTANFCSTQQEISGYINSPYSVVNGELLNLEVPITNNGKERVEVSITLNSVSKHFSAEDTMILHQVTIEPGQTTTVWFQLYIISTGSFWVEVTIVNIKTGVSIPLRKEILSKSEGTEVYVNNATLVELCDINTKDYAVTIYIPEYAVPYSVVIVVSVIGNIMGPTIDNLDNLIRIPYGCGEQLLKDTVPNIVVIEYLEVIGVLTPAKKAQAVANIQTGYTSEQAYRRPDNSFSAFQTDPKGSTWLTAYAAKSFCQAKPYINVDVSIIDAALNFVALTQQPSGGFIEFGHIIHTELQGGTSTSGSSMTAYIVISFLVNGRTRSSSTTVDKAITYLETRLPAITQSYELAIVTYALHLAGSSLKDVAFTTLLTLAIVQGDQTYFGPPAKPSLQIEATAYVILTMAFRNDVAGADPLVRYLVGKKTDLGGHSSSQNTVIGLEALAAIARLKIYCDTDITIVIHSDSPDVKFHITKENSLTLQSQVLPNTTRNAHIQVNGKGVAVVQVSWHYNLQPQQYESKSFKVSVKVIPRRDGSFEILICTSYIVIESKLTGMAIVEAEAPSGFVFLDDNLKLGEENTLTEIKRNNTVIYRYLHEITVEGRCVTFIIRKVATVIKRRPSYVKVYSYYEPETEAVGFYELPSE